MNMGLCGLHLHPFFWERVIGSEAFFILCIWSEPSIGLCRISVDGHETRVTKISFAVSSVPDGGAWFLSCGSGMEVGEKGTCKRHGIQHVRIVQVELELEGFGYRSGI